MISDIMGFAEGANDFSSFYSFAHVIYGIVIGIFAIIYREKYEKAKLLMVFGIGDILIYTSYIFFIGLASISAFLITLVLPALYVFGAFRLKVY
jgi:hypothetical protein